MLTAPIPQEFINELLSRCDIVQLIDARIPLRKKGKYYTASCPFHTEKTPSFTVTPEKQFYYCFGCAAGGNAISFLMEYERLDFVATVALLAEQYGLVMPQSGGRDESSKTLPRLYSLLEQASRLYEQQLPLSSTAVSYLKQRGVSGSIAKKFGLGYAPNTWDFVFRAFKETNNLLAVGLIVEKSDGKGFYDRFRRRIVFPIRDRRGRVIGFGGRILTNDGEPKYLNSPETTFFHKGKELYGLYETCQVRRQPERILVVEGYMDVLALFQANFSYSVATLGTAISQEQILRLLNVAQEIIFCFDGDTAGEKAAFRALEASLSLLEAENTIRFLLLPKGEDPDSLLQKQGREVFVSHLQHAKSLQEFLFGYLLAQVDLSQLEGRVRLAKLAIPLIEKVSLGILRYGLLEELARLVKMDLTTLKQVTKDSYLSSPMRGGRKLSVSNRYPPIHLVIALLIQHPELVKTLSQAQSDMLYTLGLPGSELLIKIFSLLKQSPALTSAMLLEYWRNDESTYKMLQQLIGYLLVIPELDVQAELHDRLRHLKRLDIQAKIDKLLQQGKRQTLNKEEKEHLYSLMRDISENK